MLTFKSKPRFRDLDKQGLHNPHMASELWQRLRVVRKYFGLTQQQVADAAGIDRAAVSQWEASDPDKRTRPDWQNLVHFSELTGAPVNWLTSDDSDINPDALPFLLLADESAPAMRVAEPPIRAYSIKTDDDPLADGDVRIDVADIELSAGSGRDAPEFVETIFKHTYRWESLHRVGVRDASTVKRCRVVGDSMQPMLFHGDMVTVDTANKAIVDVAAYAIVIAGQIKVKRLIRQRDGALVIRSENPAYPDEVIPANELEDVFIIGRVIDKSGRGGLGF